ncbi:MurR/RpiR family transcriptional regulator [Spiroplasma endosymbiont of Aspidapion aeneum]|uniref:MurR/RpiR family transcriptional regulator n=1 Tax=Spiroplasma endosymbiont of Aspidapion aeneum TaxID=3066276 RepID=UPI00313D01AB
MSQFDIYDEILNISMNKNNKSYYIAKYFIDNLDKIYDMKISQFSKNSFSSLSSIHRFIKQLGLSSFKELKFISKNITDSKKGTSGVKEILNNSIVENIYNENIETAKQTYKLLNSQYKKIFDISNKILNSKRIVIAAFGGTYNIARDFYNKLQRIGIFCNISQDVNNLYFLSKLLTSNDLFFIVSYSGITEEILKVIEYLNINKINKPFIVSITKNVDNPVMLNSNINIVVASNESIFMQSSSSSRSALLFALDSIYLTIINSDKEKYIDILTRTTLHK